MAYSTQKPGGVYIKCGMRKTDMLNGRVGGWQISCYGKGKVLCIRSLSIRSLILRIYKLQSVTYIFFIYLCLFYINIYSRERERRTVRARERRAAEAALRRLPPDIERERLWVRDRRWLRRDIFIYTKKKIIFLKLIIIN